MTKVEVERFVRSQLEQLSPELQDVACRRALGVSVFAWSWASREQLWALYGAVRVVSLLTVEVS